MKKLIILTALALAFAAPLHAQDSDALKKEVKMWKERAEAAEAKVKKLEQELAALKPAPTPTSAEAAKTQPPQTVEEFAAWVTKTLELDPEDAASLLASLRQVYKESGNSMYNLPSKASQYVGVGKNKSWGKNALSNAARAEGWSLGVYQTQEWLMKEEAAKVKK